MAPDIAARKGGEPIVALTAYHAHTAAIADNHCDFLLVGDSLGMVMHGFETTVPVPLELMIMHGQAVVRGSIGHATAERSGAHTSVFMLRHFNACRRRLCTSVDYCG
jgi:hypothetical protein